MTNEMFFDILKWFVVVVISFMTLGAVIGFTVVAVSTVREALEKRRRRKKIRHDAL